MNGAMRLPVSPPSFIELLERPLRVNHNGGFNFSRRCSISVRNRLPWGCDTFHTHLIQHYIPAGVEGVPYLSIRMP